MWGWLVKAFAGGIGKTVKDVGSVFTENAEARGQRQHDESMALSEQDMASLAQFTAEFQHARTGWFASFADSLNRLPRPLFAISAFASLVLVPIYPERSLEVAAVYTAMPDGFWVLLGVIVAFYFGGRSQIKSQDFKLRKDQLAIAEQVIAKRKADALAETAHAVERVEKITRAPVASAPTAPTETTGNAVIDEWLRRQEKGT